MKLLLSVYIFFFTLPFTSYSDIDVNKVIEDFSIIQNTGNAGREFWLSFIPIDSRVWYTKVKKVYILSSVKTEIEISVEGKNYSRKYEVLPNVQTIVEIDTELIEPTKLDVFDKEHSKLLEDRAVRIISEYPIIVYVFSEQSNQSEGYFAIPSSATSNKYVSMNYYSSNVFGGLIPSQTLVISAFDSTNVKLTLGGGNLAEEFITFEDGRRIETGETTNQMMNKGDVLSLRGGSDLHDLSGTLIESDKPISIISGMSETEIPFGTGTSDFLTEMEFPTNLYGNYFLFTPLINKDSLSYFRAFATEDDTKIYRNGQFIGTIAKGGGGDFGESYIEFNTWGQSTNIKPVTITSDKPIALMYYNVYEILDKTSSFNIQPLIFQVPSAEQGVKSAMISVPNNNDGSQRFITNHTVVTVPLENNLIPKDLEIHIFDSLGVLYETIIPSMQSEIVLNQFEGEYDGNLYGSFTLEMQRNKVYQIKSDYSRFTTYSYGSSGVTGYGIPTGFSLYDRSKDDNLAPVVYYEQDCNGNINSETSTIIDMPLDEENRSNLADIYMMAGENYEFDWQATDNEFIAGKTQTVNWSLTILDNKKLASALLYAVDRAGNDTIIYIESQPSAYLEMISSENEIRNPKFKTYNFKDTIMNPSSFQSLYITRVELSGKNPKFKIDSYEPDGWTPGIPIPPNQERYINYSYTDEEIKDNQTYTDSVYVGIGVNNGNEITECDFRSLSQVTVKTKYPEYSVLTGNDFGKFGEKPKITKLQDTIRNESTTRQLNISRIELKEGDQGFQISGYVPFDWKITDPIEPESEIIVDILFNPLDFDRTNQDQIFTDSLGIGILEYNTENELEEVIFNYKSEQKAVILAKEPETSIDDELILRDYIRITESSIQLLPKTVTDGFYELSIYNLVGNQLVNIDTESQKSISTLTLHSGTYIITLKSEDRILTRKMNIVR